MREPCGNSVPLASWPWSFWTTMSNFSTIHTFNHSRDGRGTRRMLSLAHLKHMLRSTGSKRQRCISFNCYINMLRIRLKQQPQRLVFQYPLQLRLRDDEYRRYMRCRFEWRIDRRMMRKFKQCNNGQRFESPIFFELWNLSLFPNEHKGKDRDKDRDKEDEKEKEKEEETVVIGIRLCALPRDVLRLKVEYRLVCVELTNATSSWTHTACFDYENYYVKLPKHTIRAQLIHDYEQLTFKADVRVLEVYDLDGNVVHKYSAQSK